MNTKKNFGYGAQKLFCIFAVILFAALSLTGCGDPEGGPTGTPDTTAPALSAGSVNRTGDTAATISFTTNEAGTAYYTVVDANATAPTPTSAQVKAGTSLNAVTAGANSGKAVTLTAGAKDIYVVVQDAAGNISAPLKIPAAAYNNPNDITYTLEQAGGEDGETDSTGITFTFSASVDSLNLTAADITVGGAAAKGTGTTFIKSGTVWTLSPITVNSAGQATVKITKTGIEAGEKTVVVYKAGETAPEYWSVTWIFNGGTASTDAQHPTQIEKGEVLAQPSPDPTKADNTFGGWYMDSGLTQAYDFDDAVTADLELYAKWEATQTGNDTTPPALSAGTAARTSETEATIGFTTNEAGTAYYLVVEKDATAPANTEVKAGTSLNAVTAGANSDKTVTLTAGAKDIYVVVEDAAGNISVPLKIAARAYTPPREVTIAMWNGGSGGGGSWSNDAALRISVNGTDLPTNARKTSSGSGPEDYTFNVNLGDEVKFYWVNGGTFDYNCAFAVYYSDDPPDPAFDPASGTAVDTSGRLLAYQQYRTSAAADTFFGNGTVMGDFMYDDDPAKAARPTANPSVRAVLSGTAITLSTITAGATIRYTTDGTEPTAASTEYTSPITITTNTTIKAIACKDGLENSAILTAAYTINRGVTIRMWDSSGNVAWGNNAALRINVNGTDLPTNARKVGTNNNSESTSFTVTLGDEVKFYWVSGGSTDYRCAFVVYYTDAVPYPTFDPASGTSDTSKVLASKRYAKDPPGPVGAGTLMGEFTFDPNKAARPTANPTAGAVAPGTAITLSPTSATIRYTTDGTDPTAASTVYSSPIPITEATTIKAIAYRDGMTNSNILTAAYTVATGPATWTAITAGTTQGTTSTFGTTGINGIAYGNPVINGTATGRWVAVGDSGKMAYSANGTSWTAIAAANSGFGTSSNTINGIAYGNGKFVAVGMNGKMAYSTNGSTWTAIAAADSGFDTYTINGIAYGGAPGGGGKFVAVGYYGRMAYSTDGINWTRVSNSTFSSATNTDNNINGIVYGGSGTSAKFVAVGGIGKMAHSTDGITWTAVTAANTSFGPSYGINGIAYYDHVINGTATGRFVAVGDGGRIAYSVNISATSWTAVKDSRSDNYFRGIAYGGSAGNERFVAVGTGGRMVYSADGINWTTGGDSKFGTSNNTIYGIAYGGAPGGGGKFVAVGLAGKMAYCEW